jgi:transglutaminase-like putative cysteine protease
MTDRHYFFLLIFFMLSLNSFCDAVAQGYDYMNPDPAAASISPDLLEDANAVIRLHHRKFELEGPGEGRMYVKKMVTILNSDGLSHASIRIPYNSFADVSRINGTLYNASGEEVQSIRNRDFDDESMISSFSLAEDSRILKGDFTHPVYPFSIEYSYHIDYSGYIQLPAWVPISSEKTSLELGELLVVMPASLDFDYRKYNIPEENEYSFQDSDQSRYRWELSSLPPIKREVMGPPWFRLFPAVVMKTNTFQMDGNPGNMESWSAFGSWFGNLWQGRDELPDFVKEEVDQMVAEYGITRELIGALYSRLQNKTRYVSIQLGIGGYQTETATSTANTLYGDCKALSNYLLAKLRYAGFDARPALIRNGGFSFPFDPDFVHNPFNHAVIAIQFEGDTIWAEATSSSYPLGYLGSSNSNRHALLFNETGGELVETPEQSPDQNYQKRQATLTLQSEGSASLAVHTEYGGSQHEHIRQFTREASTQQDRYIRSLLPFSLYDINGYQASADSARPSANLTLDLDVETFANKIGSRLMFYPNMLERRDNFVSVDENREQPVYIRSAYHDVDELTFNIPDDFSVEATPDSVALEFEFGSYSAKITPSDDGKTLYYHREIAMNPDVIPASEFESYREIMNAIWKSDNNQVVLVKN